MAVLKNRAGVITTTATNGTITLGAAIPGGTAPFAASWRNFPSAGVSDGNVVRYLILDSNFAWEYGTGTVGGGGTTLTRTLGGSSTGSLLTLSGNAQVFITAIDDDFFQGPATSTDNFLIRWDGTTGKIIQESPNASIDDSGRFLLGTPSLQSQAFGNTPSIQFHGDNFNKSTQWINIWNSDANGATIVLGKSKSSTIGTHTAVVADDGLGGVFAIGSDGLGFRNACWMVMSVDGAVAANDVPGRISFSTRPAGGAVTPAERLRIRGDGTLATFNRIEEPSTTLTDGATVALDASLGNVFHLIAAGNRTILTPTNAPASGRTQKLVIRHEASGADRTLALTTGANAFRFGSTIATLSPTLSGTTDYIGCIWNQAAARWDVVSYSKGF